MQKKLLKFWRRPISRRNFLQLGTAGMAAAWARTALSQTAEPSKRPNVVVILTDDLGYRDLSCYGGQDIKTPKLDNLAAKGMMFGNFYANAPICSPSRAALLTGRYPALVGVPGLTHIRKHLAWGYLNPRAITLPQVLHDAGYHCGMVGKWHLGDYPPNRPNDRGFDYYHGFLGGMLGHYDLKSYKKAKIKMRHNLEPIHPAGHATTVFTDWACDYVRERAKHDQPFFLYLAHCAPHIPLQPPTDWLNRVKARAPKMGKRRQRMVALVEHLDHEIGRVLDTLEKTGLAENTLIVFSNDNGGAPQKGADNGKLRGGKWSLWEGGIKVPAIAAWRNVIQPATLCNDMAMLMDWFPTICEATGISIEHEIDGRSLMPLLRGEKDSLPERTLFWTRRPGGGEVTANPIYAVRRGKYKLTNRTSDDPIRLYDLEVDPAEENPLPNKHPMYKQLKKALLNHTRKVGGVTYRPPLYGDDYTSGVGADAS